MPWTLNKLSYVQVDSFPQNEIARNRISGEKSEFDNNSATNTFGFGLQVVPLHDWKSDEGDGASIPDGGLGTVVDFVKNSADTIRRWHRDCGMMELAVFTMQPVMVSMIFVFFICLLWVRRLLCYIILFVALHFFSRFKKHDQDQIMI